MEKYVFRLQKICWYWGICLNARGGKKIKPKSKQIFPNGPLDRIVTDTWELFNLYIQNLFNSSKKYVCIYSSNVDKKYSKYVRHRKFTDWINKLFQMNVK